MKKNLNIIQIRGIKGLMAVAGLICCLAVGFIVFPGYVAMRLWNFMAAYVQQMPVIGIIQGILLWGIAAVAYFTFRKEKLIVCMRASEGLTEEELKSVFADIKKQAQLEREQKDKEAEQRTEQQTKELKESTSDKANQTLDRKSVV